MGKLTAMRVASFKKNTSDGLGLIYVGVIDPRLRRRGRVPMILKSTGLKVTSRPIKYTVPTHFCFIFTARKQ